ncbi:MAG: DUF5668 domain-containing protein [Acidobacteria bacterium]|nr:DUF5668 domain-containing protein [Acidobacteriota bacterium]
MTDSQNQDSPFGDVFSDPAAGHVPPVPPPTPAARRPSATAYAPPPAEWRPALHRKSPGLACLLSLMPGVGQVYVGYYKVGFIHNIIFGSTIAFLASGGPDALVPLMAIFLAFFSVYNIVDAGRRATLYNLALDGMEGIELPDMNTTMPSFGGSLGGGLALIILGVILLANTLFGMRLDWIEEWWPVAPILIGVYLITKALQERRAAASSPDVFPASPTEPFGS